MQHQEYVQKLDALERAGELGWCDLDSGNFEDVPLEGIGDFVRELGNKIAQEISAKAYQT